jgi:prepilin-type processing-associated H-X9-DG protein
MLRNSTVRMADILDGSSMTLVVVECAARPAVYRAGSQQPALFNDQGQGWIDSEGPFSLDGASRDGSQQGLGPVLTPVAINATNENEPFAFHPGGAQCVFADAHARLIGRNISLRVFAALVTRAGGEVVAAGDY